MPVMAASGPSTAFTDVEPDYLDPLMDTTSAEEQPAPGRRLVTWAEAAWVRSEIARLGYAAGSLKREVRAIVQDLPRFVEFREKLRTFLKGPMGITAEQRAELAPRIRSAPIATHYIQEVLRQCASALRNGDSARSGAVGGFCAE